ncbi:alpha/beta fold hydrolase [Nocardioides humilatus]|uniref:Alpha/beta fold hydrolase n=1 Tax=Nocardioides humilatus TaxID=2607660 RepID=A0A5B1L9H9_9ACTN|nr:alpha/beta fold hydrolase [Nocardioides humilatus]KAA1416430.1 alpha/beta fold hydrolase [Nocardioides humilatus]
MTAAALSARISGLHVEVVGRGAPLLVAHGGPGMSHDLYRTLDPLAEHRQLVFWDHRGHGRSGDLPAGEVEMSLFADDVVTVADGLGIDRFALFGHSFGGWVAQEAALRHPDRISSLVLAGTTPGQLGVTESPDDPQGPPPPAELAALLGELPSTDAGLVEMYRKLAPFFARHFDPTEISGRIDPALVSADTCARVFAALGRWSSVDRLAEIACPTLLLAGRYDDFCSVEQHERIARRLPDPDLVVIDDAGHFTWLDRPEVLDVLAQWVADRG